MRHLLAVAIVLVFPAAAQAAIVRVGAAGHESPGLDTEETLRGRSLIERLEKPDEPGCALGVQRQGRWLFKAAYGLADLESRRPNTPELVFGIASMTKQFTAAATALAAHRGYFSLDDDIRRYLPGIPDYGAVITVRDLVLHLDGLRDHGRLVTLTGKPHRYDSVEQRIALLARQRDTNYPAGTAYRYGNSGYLLLATLIERRTGLSLARFAGQNIFQPLDMRDSYFGVDTRPRAGRSIPYSRTSTGWQNTDSHIASAAFQGGGGMMTTLDDYAKWVGNLLGWQSRLAGGPRLMAMLRSPGRLRDGTSIEYGFGLHTSSYRGIEAVTHGGSGAGYKAYGMMFPARALAVIGFCNNGTFAQATVMDLADIYLHLPPRRAVGSAVNGVTLSRDALLSFEGSFREPSLRWPMQVLAREGRLIVYGGLDEDWFTPLSSTSFGNSQDEVIQFVVESDGRARAIRQLGDTKYGTGIFERVERLPLTSSQLEAYAGDYYSADLDATYRFTLQPGGLEVRIANAEPGVRPFHQQPFVTDELVSFPDRLSVQFTRAPDGAVHGARVTHQFGWITDIRFVRVHGP